MEGTPSVDIIVIGGGISGLGIAATASERGHSIAVLEKDLCCRATSNASLRIIHGGFRYLQHLNLPRVVESLADQVHLLKNNPDLVKEIPCLMPLNKLGLKSKYPVWAALGLYRAIGLLSGSPKQNIGSVLSEREVSEKVPILEKLTPAGALLWYDAIMPEPLTVAEFLKTEITKAGHLVLEQSPVTKVEKQGSAFLVDYQASGEAANLQGKVVVNATGPWLNTFDPPVAELQKKVPRYWCKGFNIILNKKLLSDYAVGVESAEGRLYFLVPRGDRSVIGTVYIPYKGAPEEVLVTDEELDRAILGFNSALPEAALSADDIAEYEVGVLPCKAIKSGEPVLYGAERIYDCGGFINVLSTKYTTFRSQADKVLRMAANYLS